MHMVILIVIMRIVIDFVEKEDPFTVSDWSSTVEAKREIECVYKFAKCYREYSLKIKMKYLCHGSKGSLYWARKLRKLEEQMMIRLINVRRFMWT